MDKYKRLQEQLTANYSSLIRTYTDVQRPDSRAVLGAQAVGDPLLAEEESKRGSDAGVAASVM